MPSEPAPARRRMQRAACVITASAVLAVMIVGCTESSPPVPTRTSTIAPVAPTPTPTPQRAIIPFGDDCDRAIPLAQIRTIFDGPGFATVLPRALDRDGEGRSNAALLGGLHCLWEDSSSDLGSYALLDLFPIAVVPGQVRGAWTEFSCDYEGYCGRAITNAGTWVLATTLRASSPEEPLTSVERSTLVARTEAMLDAVSSADPIELVARPADADSKRWTIPPCTELEDAVATAAQMDAPEQGFPGDMAPRGTVWDTLVGQRLADWCPWYQFITDSSILIVEVYLFPGMGAPSESALTDAGAQPLAVTGADSAWRVSGDRGPQSMQVLAVSGPNRVTVTAGGDTTIAEAQAVAAAVIEQLEG